MNQTINFAGFMIAIISVFLAMFNPIFWIFWIIGIIMMIFSDPIGDFLDEHS